MAKKRSESTKKTFAQSADISYLEITLPDLGINKDNMNYIDGSQIDPDLFKRLVLLTPTTQSNLGKKFNQYIINNNNLQEYIEELCERLKLDDKFFFTSYASDNEKNKNLFSEVKNGKTNMMVLKKNSGLKESLYSSVRNALAHGNIIKHKKGYALFSFSGNDNNKGEIDRCLSFYLWVKDLELLKAYVNELDKYEKRDWELK